MLTGAVARTSLIDGSIAKDRQLGVVKSQSDKDCRFIYFYFCFFARKGLQTFGAVQ